MMDSCVQRFQSYARAMHRVFRSLDGEGRASPRFAGRSLPGYPSGMSEQVEERRDG